MLLLGGVDVDSLIVVECYCLLLGRWKGMGRLIARLAVDEAHRGLILARLRERNHLAHNGPVQIVIMVPIVVVVRCAEALHDRPVIVVVVTVYEASPALLVSVIITTWGHLLGAVDDRGGLAAAL